ncbi:MAG: hypothetical protein WCR02_04995 [Sphaerochaetaceae bacterium]
MTRKEYRSIVFWITVMVICIVLGFVLLALLLQDKPLVVLLFGFALAFILVFMIKAIKKLGDSTSEEK